MPTDQRALPIGVFDSGLGGLTVVREIRRQLPAETVLYLGDNARVPYGTRSAATIERYATNCAEFLLKKGLKLLVVACNTVSATALPQLRRMTDIPVLGVISAGAQAVVDARARRVGVIGTESTIASGAYNKEISALQPECRLFSRATPLFVPLAEEGWLEGTVPEAAATHYLGPLVEKNIEILLLGCTHYPILKGVISKSLASLGSTATVVDSAVTMAAEVAKALKNSDLEAVSDAPRSWTCFVTDLPSSFERTAGRFLGEPPSDFRLVDLL